MLTQEIKKYSNGAQFRRADLHIHSFGENGSYDVNDTTMTPENIVDTAISENLEVIAITDHNQIGNIRSALKHAEGKNILVVPGVELSTPQGYFLVYFETVDQIKRFFGKLNISSNRQTCHDTIPQCLKYAEEFDGFGICAHIESDAGFENAHPKYDAFKQDILNCKNLLALEITKANDSSWFTHSDVSPDRKNCAKLRCNHLGYDEGTELAKVMSSDAHNCADSNKIKA